MKHYWSIVSLVATLYGLLFVRNVCCQLEKMERSQLFCGACIALIEEINWQTGIVSPKKKMQIGSFQLDAKGNMHVREVPLAQSEVHITEVMETVCRYMFMYTQFTDQKGNTNFIRTTARDGVPISKRHTVELNEKYDTLEYACDVILEAHDDELMRMYQAKEEEISEKLCVDMTGLCSRENVTDQMWAYASAVMMGLTEKAAEAGDPKAKEKMAAVEEAERMANGEEDEEEEELENDVTNAGTTVGDATVVRSEL
jgi:hypothetical protein